jgi:hypothetical protein
MTEPATPNIAQAEALARIEVKLDTVLESQREQKSALDQHARDIVDHGTRLTKLEAHNTASSESTSKTYSGKQLAATSTAAAAAVAGVVTTILRAAGKA